MGIYHYAITSDGVKPGNPKYYREYEKKIGSNKRYKTRVKVAKIQEKIARCREDFLHKHVGRN